MQSGPGQFEKTVSWLIIQDYLSSSPWGCTDKLFGHLGAQADGGRPGLLSPKIPYVAAICMQLVDNP